MSNLMASLQDGAGLSSELPHLDFTGRNPGALDARVHIPDGLPAGAPLVVVLHGCTQTASGFDHGTGWTTLADRGEFAVLFPEQTRANNPNLCFNWFTPGDITRTGGEAESIAAMMEHMVGQHLLARDRVYVTGLSAGGAMTAVMLATYPELFAGGAIIGGLPYGSATGVPQALMRMRGEGQASDAQLKSLVCKAPPHHAGPWPTVSIWHGTADATVAVANMDGLGRQWRAVHGVGGAQPTVEQGKNWEHRSWSGGDRRIVVEEWTIVGMGHGVPLDTRGDEPVGHAGAFMLDAGISSTSVIAASWGLIKADQTHARAARSAPQVAPTSVWAARKPVDATALPQRHGVQTVIEDALRAAGLMR